MPQSWDMGQIIWLPLRRKACWEFLHEKNTTASAGFEPANSGNRDQHANDQTTETVVDIHTKVTLEPVAVRTYGINYLILLNQLEGSCQIYDIQLSSINLPHKTVYRIHHNYVK
jgi:hypothetical protein